MLKEIYREIIKHEHDTVRREGLVDDLIDQVTEPYKDQLSDRDIERHSSGCRAGRGRSGV